MFHVPLSLKNIGRGPAFRMRLYEFVDKTFELVQSEDCTLPVLEQNAVDYLAVHTTVLRSAGQCMSHEFKRRLYSGEIERIKLAIEYDDVLQATWRSYVVIEAGETEDQINCRFLRIERQATQQR